MLLFVVVAVVGVAATKRNSWKKYIFVFLINILLSIHGLQAHVYRFS
jgi:uncharacterized membrane protein